MYPKAPESALQLSAKTAMSALLLRLRTMWVGMAGAGWRTHGL